MNSIDIQNPTKIVRSDSLKQGTLSRSIWRIWDVYRHSQSQQLKPSKTVASSWTPLHENTPETCPNNRTFDQHFSYRSGNEGIPNLCTLVFKVNDTNWNRIAFAGIVAMILRCKNPQACNPAPIHSPGGFLRVAPSVQLKTLVTSAPKV